MEIDVDTGEAETRRFYALDDCGTRINPMIIEGQVHGGLTEALAIAMGQEIAYDAQGNVMTGSLMDFEAQAGLDLGGVDPDEIALSVIARIVQLENRRRRPRPATSSG